MNARALTSYLEHIREQQRTPVEPCEQPTTARIESEIFESVTTPGTAVSYDICSRCGSSPRYMARFCDACGAKFENARGGGNEQ